MDDSLGHRSNSFTNGVLNAPSLFGLDGRSNNNGVLPPESILAFNLVSPLSAHFLEGSRTGRSGRRRYVSFDLGTARDLPERRSSILSVLRKSKGTVLRYMELERVTIFSTFLFNMKTHIL